MKRRLGRATLGLLLATLGHFLVWQLAPDFAPGIDLFVVVTMLSSVRGGQVEGMLVGTVAGLVADAISGAPLGLHTFAFSFAGYAVGFAADRVAEMTELAAGLLATLGALLSQGLVIVLLYLFVTATPSLTWWWPVAVAGSTVALVWLIRLTGHLGTRLGGWQRSRHRERLKL